MERKNVRRKNEDSMKIDGKTRLLGLLGDPVAHTMSPEIQNSLAEYLGINTVYVPFHTKSAELADAVKGAFALNIFGLNVTVPHKNAVMKYLCDVDKGAEAIGAVNTLVRCENGYKGYNTDMMGLSRELDSYGISLTDRDVLILGAGGAAKAVSYMCVLKGAGHVYILNRTISKAEEIASHMNHLFGKNVMIPMELSQYKVLPESRYIVFQATSIGLAPNDDAVVIEDEDFYRMVDIGIDLIYKPFSTKFMKLCRENGAAAYNGLKMLLYQGVIAYELWNHIHVSEDIVEKVYRKLAKGTRDNIVLTGFMGSGKTTIGKSIAKKYGYDFLDTDQYIEEKQGCSIREIFADKGEGYFRNLEREMLQELTHTLYKTVISTGGGLPLEVENSRLLSALGKVVYLDITPEEVAKRLQGDMTRPLLACDNPKERIQKLLEFRAPLYEAGADMVVSVAGRTVDEIEAEIMKQA